MPEARDDLTSRVVETARRLGAYRAGVASLEAEPLTRALREQGDEWVASFPRAVSLAFRLQDAVVDRLPTEHRSPLPAKVYGYHIYTVVNRMLDHFSTTVADVLQGAGYGAAAVPTSLAVDTEGLKGPLSHKMVAREAGLGWIGRSCLLVEPAAGPRVRLVTVLTDAPLVADTPMERDCGACTSCVEACPAHAFSGRAFDPTEPLQTRMDVRACIEYRLQASQDSGTEICGVCVAVCPHGRRGRKG